MAITLTLILFASMIIMLYSAIRGKNNFNRIMCVNCLTSYMIAFIAILGTFEDRDCFIDIAIIYALTNFIATIGFLKYFKYKKI